MIWMAVLYWRNKHAIAIKERDALQLRLNAADQRNDEFKALLNELVQIWAASESTLELARAVEKFAPRARDAIADPLLP